MFFDKKNAACQSDPSFTTCKTQIDISTQTLSPSPYNQLESYTLTDNINLSKNITTETNEQLLKSALDVSSTSFHEDVLMDIFLSSSEPVSNVTSVPQKNHAIPLVMLPYIGIPNQPFSDFCLRSLD